MDLRLLKKTGFIDYILAIVSSFYLTKYAYKILYEICHYANLEDFYVGTSIYEDHNKYLDISIYVLYVVLVLAFLFVFVFLREKICFLCKNNFKLTKKYFSKFRKSILNIEPLKLPYFIYKYQAFGAIGYIFLHPFNGHFYPVIFLLIVALISISLFDIKRINRNTEKISLSPWVIAPFLFLFFYLPYTPGTVPLDDHHFGEMYATFFMHDKFNLEYYKDIMLVHGYKDVIPAWIGKHIFYSNTIYGYCLGDIFWQNISFLIVLICGLFIFSGAPVFAFLILLAPHNPFNIYLAAYLLMLKKSFIQKPFLLLCVYILLSFLFISYWTTLGTFWTLSVLPLAIYLLYKLIKEDGHCKVLKLLILAALSILALKYSMPAEYLNQSQFYIKGNLFAFGNMFDQTFYIFLPFTIKKCFALLIVPFFIVELIKELSRKEKSIDTIAFYLFVIIFPIISLNYTLGRIDGGRMTRIAYISIPYLMLVLPYYLYKRFPSPNGFLKFLFQLVLIMLVLSNIKDASSIKQHLSLKYNEPQSVLIPANIGNIKIYPSEVTRLQQMKIFVDKYSQNDGDFFDLTNKGMNYLYADKKIPVHFVSFYNSISSAQAEISVNRLKQNPPNIILIDSITNSIPTMHDYVYPSLRINSVYRWILLQRNYRLVKYGQSTYLLRTETPSMYSDEELKILDKTLCKKYLEFLPEVWGKSLSTLPLEEKIIKFITKITPREITVKFDKPQKGRSIGLMYFEPLKEIPSGILPQKYHVNRKTARFSFRWTILHHGF